MKTCIDCGEPCTEHAFDIYDGSGPFCPEHKEASEAICRAHMIELGIIKPLPPKGSFSNCTNDTNP